MKKSITLLLVLCMFVSLFSGMAFAADAAPETEDTIGTEPTDVSAAQAAEADVPAALSQAA